MGGATPPVCLLLLNHGMVEQDLAVHRDATFRAALVASLADDAAPHFHLASMSGGPAHRWRSRALASVCRELRVKDARALQNAVSAIKLFPYHSRKFDHAGIRLPSAAATVARVEEQLERRTILIVRSWRIWVGMIPALADPFHADHVIRLRGRGVYLRKNTLGSVDAFEAVVEVMRTRVTNA